MGPRLRIILVREAHDNRCQPMHTQHGEVEWVETTTLLPHHAYRPHALTFCSERQQDNGPNQRNRSPRLRSHEMVRQERDARGPYASLRRRPMQAELRAAMNGPLCPLPGCHVPHKAPEPHRSLAPPGAFPAPPLRHASPDRRQGVPPHDPWHCPRGTCVGPTDLNSGSD